MMNTFQIALLIGAVVTALLAWRLPRAVLWITVGAADFAATTAYARYALPYPPLFTLFVDAAVCIAIFFHGRRGWEYPYLYLVFLGMVLMSLLYIAGVIDTHWGYIGILETLNWIALLVIGGTAILQRVDANELGTHPSGWSWAGGVRGTYSALRRKRTGFPKTPGPSQ